MNNNESYVTVSNVDCLEGVLNTVKWSNKWTKIKIVIGDNIYCLAHYSDNCVHMWAKDGSVSIGHVNLNEKNINKSIIENITNYENGYIKCSDCGKLIKFEEIKGYYFAGRYCKDCWENNGWKEMESRETYD